MLTKHHLIESYNSSAQSHTSSKLQNLDPKHSDIDLNDAGDCSSTGQSNDSDTGPAAPAPITDKAALWTRETCADMSSGRTHLGHVNTDCNGDDLDPEVPSAKLETKNKTPSSGVISTPSFSLPDHISF